MKRFLTKGQAAVEYMIILAAVAIVVMVGYNAFYAKTQEESEAFYNRAVNQILDEAPQDRTFATNNP